MKKERNVTAFILVALAILILQILYSQLLIQFQIWFAHRFIQLNNDYYLMAHHSVMFLLVFIPTFILQKTKKIDFGYHIKDWKKGIIWLFIGLGYELIVALIVNIIYGFGITLNNPETYIFQFFFSGLGEEIPYRAIPLVLLPLAYGTDPVLRIGSKIKLPIDVIIAALFFSIGHIMFVFGQPNVSYSIAQLISAFGAGIIFGMMFKKSNCIWLCMLAHGLYNLLAITF